MEAPVQPGDTLAGRYRIERVLGMGGMGVVVAAHDVLLDRRVAIKYLLGGASLGSEAVARFAREARSAARIESEHVARVIDVGSLPSGAPYMVMEYLDGGDLAHCVSERGALPIEEAVDYVLQACEAIAEAHALGIVHRDLKPANLFLARRADGSDLVKVLDFGISKVASDAQGSSPEMSLTRTSAVMGSPLYMAPEQMRSSRGVDVRADIWALGVILYELVSGRVPFEAATMPELCAMLLEDPTPPLRERCPRVPGGFAFAVERCLRKDPAERFSNVSELANELVKYAPAHSRLSSERISRVLGATDGTTRSDDMPPNAQPPGPRGESTGAAWFPARTGSGRRSSAIGRSVATIAGLAVLGGLALLVIDGKRTSEDPAASFAGTVSAPPAQGPAPSAAESSPPAVTTQPALSARLSNAAPVAALGATASAADAATPIVHREPALQGKTPKLALARTAAAASAPAPAPSTEPAAPAPSPKKRNPLDLGFK